MSPSKDFPDHIFCWQQQEIKWPLHFLISLVVSFGSHFFQSVNSKTKTPHGSFHRKGGLHFDETKTNPPGTQASTGPGGEMAKDGQTLETRCRSVGKTHVVSTIGSIPLKSLVLRRYCRSRHGLHPVTVINWALTKTLVVWVLNIYIHGYMIFIYSISKIDNIKPEEEWTGQMVMKSVWSWNKWRETLPIFLTFENPQLSTSRGQLYLIWFVMAIAHTIGQFIG